MSVTRRGLGLVLAAAAVVGLIVLPAAVAQTAGDADLVASAAGTGMSWRDIVQNGGKLMYVLSALSVLTVALVIYFTAVLRAGGIAPRALHREIVDKIRAGSIEEARRACEYRGCPLSAIALAAMDYLRDVPDADAMMLKDIVEGEGSRQSEAIQGQTQYLMDVATIAPMVGLLGTVFGMLRAFSSVALDIANAKPVVLAAGVSQALVTTAFGLIVGIPAMAFYAFFRRRASKLVATLEMSSSDVLAALASTRSK